MARDIKHIGDLAPDPANTRKHNPRNIGMVADALNEVGAARSIVIDENGTILAGNGVVEAAAQTIIAVRRSGLTEQQKKRLALFDNRAQEMSDWDTDAISTLLDADGEMLDGLWTGDELADLLGEGGARFDRSFEEIDLERLPAKPTWCLIAIPMEKLADVQPLLDQIEGVGVRVEISSV